MRGLAAQARELGHELSPWLRQDDESIAFCTRCTAHVYVRTSGDWVVDEDGLRELCEGLLVRVVWPAGSRAFSHQ